MWLWWDPIISHTLRKQLRHGLQHGTFFLGWNLPHSPLGCYSNLGDLNIPKQGILYCTGWYGQYIPYRPVHWYKYPYCFISEKILAVPASYRPCRQNPAVSAGKWIPGKDREIPKKNSHEFSELTQSFCTWLEPELEPEPEPELESEPTITDNPNPPIPIPKNPTHTTQPPHKHTTHEQKSGRRLSLLCISPNKTHWFKNK